MNKDHSFFSGRQIRLFVDLPYPDETWASFFDRAARRYGCNRKALIRQLLPEWHEWLDVDLCLPERLYSSLLTALGATEDEVSPCNRGVTANALPSRLRVDYCPLCFLEDLKRRRTPNFRFQWTIPFLTTCHIHGTPLLRWRSIRYGDERLLPLSWTLRPSSKLAAECAWLDEDARFADRFAESRLSKSHPLTIVRRFAAQTVQLTGMLPSWNRLDAEFGFCIDALIGLAASTCEAARPLAEQLRPIEGGDRLFGPPASVCASDVRYPSLVWNSPAFDVGYRRSILWFLAKNIVGSRSKTKLAVGETVSPGRWDSWWNLVKKLAPPNQRDRLRVEEKRMTAGDQWRAAQGRAWQQSVRERLTA